MHLRQLEKANQRKNTNGKNKYEKISDEFEKSTGKKNYEGVESDEVDSN